jgi:hypothetical protein
LSFYQPFLPEAMRLAVEGVKSEDSYLRECTWSFFSSMAKLYEVGEESSFDPFFAFLICDPLV